MYENWNCWGNWFSIGTLNVETIIRNIFLVPIGDGLVLCANFDCFYDTLLITYTEKSVCFHYGHQYTYKLFVI